MFASVRGVLLLIVVLTGCYGEINLGDYLKLCDRNSLELNECMAEAVQKGIAVMADGIKDLGIPPLDPFYQKELRVEYKNNQLAAKMNMQNIYVQGLKEAKVHGARVQADDDRLHIEIDLSAPKISVNGHYQGGGQFNALKINASGEFNNTMLDLTWTWKLDGIPEKNGNETYVRINSFYMRPDVGKMLSYLRNDNTDSRELTQLGNTFLNENWRILYRELIPHAQANWNKTGTRLANKIFLRIPYVQVFPSSL